MHCGGSTKAELGIANDAGPPFAKLQLTSPVASCGAGRMGTGLTQGSERGTWDDKQALWQAKLKPQLPFLPSHSLRTILPVLKGIGVVHNIVCAHVEVVIWRLGHHLSSEGVGRE